MSLPPFLVKAEGAVAAEFHKETQVVSVYLHNSLIDAAQVVVNDLHEELQAYKKGQIILAVAAFILGGLLGSVL